jgi:GT2 family glycosyltransferase
MSVPSVSAIIVQWRQQKWLSSCLEYVLSSTGVDCEVVLVNNERGANLEPIVRQFAQVRLVDNDSNVGFSAACNDGIRRTRSEFVLFLNADVFVRPDCVRLLAQALRTYDQVGFAHGKLMMQDAPDRIDGAGIAVSRGRRFSDRGRGQIDAGQFDRKTMSMAGCGALLMFRRAALEDVRFSDEYFDEDFFAYKEDIDLCWRAWWRGWRGCYVPSAVALHVRGHGLPRLDDVSSGGLAERVKALKSHREDAGFIRVRVISTRNQCWLELKNEPASWTLMDLPWRIGAWVMVLAYAIFFERYMLRGFAEALRGLPRIWKKRRAINASRRVSPRALRSLFKHGGLVQEVGPHELLAAEPP